MTVVAAITLVGAVLLALPPPQRQRIARLAESPEGNRRRVRWRLLALPLTVLAPALGGLLLAGASGAAVGYCIGLVTLTGWTTWLDHGARKRGRAYSEQVVAGCLSLTSLLRVGHVPAAALQIAGESSAGLAEAAAVQAVGGQVPVALRRTGATPGGAGLVELAIAWEVSTRTGASLTTTLDALAERLDSARKLRRVVDAELAAPRATSRMLAALPLAGLGLGFAFGGDPVEFLLGTGFGELVLCLGVTLACAGVWWTERIARAAGG